MLAEGWNFGPGSQEVRPVSWIVQHVAKRWGEGAHWEIDSHPQPHEATLLSLDCSKSGEVLKWFPCLSLEEALDWVVDWYKAFARGEDMRAISLQQIEAYQQKRTVGNRELAVR